jgi:hypothetical protein
MSKALPALSAHPKASDFEKIFYRDRQLLSQTQFPIFTVSATYHEDLKELHHLSGNDSDQDIVFSRAHYSMTLALALRAWGEKIDPRKAWFVDPSNYVTGKQLMSLQVTDLLGKLVARFALLKFLKDFVDRFGRQKLPILASITDPTLYLAQEIQRPILSLHIATGNILAKTGKEVYQVITDPHVRADYLENAELPNMHFFVFDEDTKLEFFHLAKQLGKKIKDDPKNPKVRVSGPMIDQRILAIGEKKRIWQPGDTLRICLTTGGLGTNREEIFAILEKLLPEIKAQIQGKSQSQLPRIELIFYAGTHPDLYKQARILAKKYAIRYDLIQEHDPARFGIGEHFPKPRLKTLKSRFAIIFHPQLVDANELLIQRAFPWADLFISKPSGDMAYDAVLSGAALLTLKEWGDWEYNVRHVFESRYVSKKCDSKNIIEQLEQITYSNEMRSKTEKKPSSPLPKPELRKNKGEGSWLSQAMTKSHHLEPIFSQGTKNILKTLRQREKS